MSSLAKIIYEETGISQSSAPDEYEEIASACRRFALHCDPRQPLTDEQINDHRLALGYDIVDLPDPWDFKQGVRAAERAHGIGGEA